MGKKKMTHSRAFSAPETVPSLDREEQKMLCQIFGFQQLHPHQIAATAAIASGSDVLLLAGTSQGKTEAMLGSSLLHSERGLTVLIEPLRALQADMLRRLEKLGATVVLLNSDVPVAAYNAATAAIKANRVSFVLTTPEQLEKGPVLRALNSAGVAAVIVDEVHCLLEYGGDFRPAYDRIGAFIRHLDRKPVIAACTATLAPDSIKRVEKSLAMKRPVLIRGPSDRPEIRQYIVEIGTELTRNDQDLLENERLHRLKKALKRNVKKGDAAIVYCNTVKQTAQVFEKLERQGYHVAPFYADMPKEEKAEVLEAFRSETPPVVVATSAFGLGIDAGNVRLVVHMSMPLSIEDYWQKTGRAGRDGKKAHSYVFWHHGDYQTNKRTVGPDAVKLRKLDRLRDFFHSSECCVQALRTYFGEDAGKRCKRCSRCLESK